MVGVYFRAQLDEKSLEILCGDRDQWTGDKENHSKRD